MGVVQKALISTPHHTFGMNWRKQTSPRPTHPTTVSSIMLLWLNEQKSPRENLVKTCHGMFNKRIRLVMVRCPQTLGVSSFFSSLYYSCKFSNSQKFCNVSCLTFSLASVSSGSGSTCARTRNGLLGTSSSSELPSSPSLFLSEEGF